MWRAKVPSGSAVSTPPRPTQVYIILQEISPQLCSCEPGRIRRWESRRAPEFGPLGAKNVRTVFGLLSQIGYRK
jgi:hypothetical protein